MSLTQEIRRVWESLEGRGVLGQRVDRATADMGATAVRIPIYEITGGEILLTCLYGVMTTAGAGGANAVQFDNTPTTGTIGYMDDGAGSINGTVEGDVIGPQGDILLPAVEAAHIPGIPIFSRPMICQIGTIGITKSGAVDAGDWRFVLYFIPLTDGANVVVA